MPHSALIEPAGAGQATFRWLNPFEADRTHRCMTMTVQRPLARENHVQDPCRWLARDLWVRAETWDR